ncbi:hypothetical protein [Streptomyces sp. NPDC050428]|uniref:hypothetical protein n=1 Tax=Streptomyces sp. NPDC050428 TaxID=3155757 RepID=UPI00342613AE
MTETPRADDWLDRLYDDDPAPAPAAPAPAAPAAAPTPIPAAAHGGGRLPAWWERKKAVLAAPAPVEPAPAPTDAPVRTGDVVPTAPALGAPTTPVAPTAAPAPAKPEVPARGAPAPTGHTAEIRAAAGQTVRAFLSDPRQRRDVGLVLYNGTAAGVGWWTGAGPWIHGRLVHYGATDTDQGVYVGLGVVAVCLIAEMRSHRWRRPGMHPVWRLLGWAARIPLATALLALALYGPDAAI